MASVNEVYSALKSLANKDERGFITPKVFNTFAAVAQNKIFNDLFNEMTKGQTLRARNIDAKTHFSFNKRIDPSVSKDPKNAKKLLKKRIYMLVLLDVALDQPYFNLACKEFCVFIKRNYPKLSIIATTGKNLEPSEMWTLFKIGIVDFIYKPKFQIIEFRQCIQVFLRKSSFHGRPVAPVF